MERRKEKICISGSGLINIVPPASAKVFAVNHPSLSSNPPGGAQLKPQTQSRALRATDTDSFRIDPLAPGPSTPAHAAGSLFGREPQPAALLSEPGQTEITIGGARGLLRKLPGGLLGLLGGLEARQQGGGAANPPGAARCGEPGGCSGEGEAKSGGKTRGCASLPCPSRPPGGELPQAGRCRPRDRCRAGPGKSSPKLEAAPSGCRGRAASGRWDEPGCRIQQRGNNPQTRGNNNYDHYPLPPPQELPGFSRDAGKPLARENRRGGPGVPAPRRILPGSRSGASSPGAGGLWGLPSEPDRPNSIVSCTPEPPGGSGATAGALGAGHGGKGAELRGKKLPGKSVPALRNDTRGRARC